MVGLLTLISYFIPSASDCYLSKDMIDPSNHAELRAISREIAIEEEIDIREVESILSCIPFRKKDKNYVRKVTGTNVPIATRYEQFKNRLVNAERINKGAKFYYKHKAVLEDAYEQYGVDPYIITAIIGSETAYGAFLGNANTRHVLVDVAINTPDTNKKEFFRKELKALLQLSIRNNMDIHSLKGSWDGGFGISQFMPRSYQTYAISKKNEKADLFDAEDAIYSIANYLKQHGFSKHQHVVQSIDEENIDPDFNYDDGNKPVIRYTKGQAVVEKQDDTPYIYRVKLSDNAYEYWEKGPNFYAISAYNPRPHYVISIHQLAKAIHERINTTTA